MDKATAIAILKESYGLHSGGKIYTLIAYVNRAGTVRGVRVFIVMSDGICEITKLVCWALGEKHVEGKGRIMKGYGYDTAYQTVLDLEWALYADKIKLNYERI